MAYIVAVAASVATLLPGAAYAAAVRDYNTGLEDDVREYFEDIPVMIEIARCESEFTQYGKTGQPLHGGTGTMIGLFQISEILHRKTAAKFDWDIDTPEGNMAYARFLYEQNGTSPWLDSKYCWNAPASVARAKAAADVWAQKQALAESDVSNATSLADIHQQLTTLLQKIMLLQSKQTVAIKTI